MRPTLVEAVQPPRHDADGEHPLVHLARRSPQAAWQAAGALSQSRWRERLRRFVAALWVERAPIEALSAFETMDDVRMPTEWMFEMLGRWMAVDEEAAADWALATGAGRPRVLMAGAMNWILDNGKPPDAALAAAKRLLRRWGHRAPAAAYKWSTANLSPAVRKKTNQSLFAHWGVHDPVAAAATSHEITDLDERAWSQGGAFIGMAAGIEIDQTPEQQHARMLAIDGVYDSLVAIAASRGNLGEPSGRGFGGAMVHKLYEYWKDADPERAAKYKESAERYAAEPQDQHVPSPDG